MILTDIEIISGIFSLIFVVISAYIGLRIISKYFKLKKREFLFFGLTWIFVGELWWSSAVSFIFAVLTNNTLPELIYFFIGNVFIPLALPIWLVVFTEFRFKDNKKKLIIISLVIGAIYEIIFMVTLFTNIPVIGEMSSVVDAEYRNFVIVYLISVLLVFFITGMIFSLDSIKVRNPEIRLRGKFLIISFILFTIGAGLDGLKSFLFSDLSLLLFLVIDRILLILSALGFYIGFTMPDRIKNFFLKNQIN